MKTLSRILSLAGLAIAAAQAESLILVPSPESRISAVCASTVHDFTTEVHSPIVTVETGDKPGELKAAKVVASYSSVKTGDESRDKDMRKRFKADANPSITYVVKSFVADKTGALTAKGELTWNGQTKALDIPVKTTIKGDELTVDADFTVDHRDWGLEKIRSMMVLTVDPVLKFTVRLRGKLAPVSSPKATPAATPGVVAK